MDGMRNIRPAGIPAGPRALFVGAMIVAAALIVGRQGSAAEPAAETWRIGEIAGEARSRVGNGPWRALRPGESVAPRSEIETGPDSRILLNGPEGVLAMLPNSRIVLAGRDGDRAGSTRIVQRAGSVQLRVAVPPDAPLQIETPLLSAAVARASFTITVNARNAAIYVSDGAAQISSMMTGEQAELRTRQMGWVNAPTGGWLKTIAVRPHAAPARRPARSPAKAPTRAPHRGTKALARLATNGSAG